MAEKERLDVLLVQQGLAESRELAKAYIMAGDVYVNGVKEEKAGTKIDIAAKLEVRAQKMKYVSRGGYKLEKAINEFGVNVEDCICADIGASTGGFTDCMLQNGAKKVYSIDVGYGQFAWKLRSDPRVVCLEKTNVRYITEEQVPEKIQFASIDVSFISLKKVVPAVLGIMSEAGKLVCLIKPQFEAGKENVGKKGVVRDPAVHCNVVQDIISFAADNQLGILNLSYSPIKGPEGNIEYLIYLSRNEAGMGLEAALAMAEDVVKQAHDALDNRD